MFILKNVFLFVFVLACINLRAGEFMVPNDSNSYILPCVLLPVNNEILNSGKVTIEVLMDKREDDQDKIRTVILVLSPGNIKVSYKIMKECIIEVAIESSSITMFSSELDLSQKKKIFPLNSDDVWASPIASSMDIVLKETSIIKYLQPFWGKGKTIQLTIKQIPVKDDNILSFELIPPEGPTRKYYIDKWKEDFSMKQFMANKEILSLEFYKKNLNFINKILNICVQTSYKENVLYFMDKKRSCKKYNSDGENLPLPQFKFKIVK